MHPEQLGLRDQVPEEDDGVVGPGVNDPVPAPDAARHDARLALPLGNEVVRDARDPEPGPHGRHDPEADGRVPRPGDEQVLVPVEARDGVLVHQARPRYSTQLHVVQMPVSGYSAGETLLLVRSNPNSKIDYSNGSPFKILHLRTETKNVKYVSEDFF